MMFSGRLRSQSVFEWTHWEMASAWVGLSWFPTLCCVTGTKNTLEWHADKVMSSSVFVLQCVCAVAVLPSVSCRSRTLRIWDSGISVMCLSGGGGLVCPSGLLNVLITLCRFLAICGHTHTHTPTDCNIGSKREERKLVCPCVILNGAWVYFAVCGQSCHRLLGNKSMRPS